MNKDYNRQMDRALRLLGSAAPRPGMEDRITARLAQAALAPKPRLFSLPRLALGMAASVAACLLIIAASVTHSRHILPISPGLNLPGAVQPGVGAASAAHAATQPVTTLPQDRPRSVREENGRARISLHAKKPAGVAVPKALPARK